MFWEARFICIKFDPPILKIFEQNIKLDKKYWIIRYFFVVIIAISVTENDCILFWPKSYQK